MDDQRYTRNYLSFGGGVNSVALYLMLQHQGEEFEAVFVDHGADWPETYDYVDYLIKRGFKITIIKGERRGLPLYEYCMKYKIMPSGRLRWCTEEFKVNPLHDYFKKPCIDMIGIDAGEKHRAKHRGGEDIFVDYPLVDAGFDRNDCIELIKEHGLKVPPKSGCWFCPFQKRTDVRRLSYEDPCLFDKVRELENLVVEKQLAKGKKPYYLYRMPIDAYARSNQPDLFMDKKPCRCMY